MQVRPEAAMEITQKFVENILGMTSNASMLPMIIHSAYTLISFLIAFHGVPGKSTATKRMIGRRKFNPL